MSVVQTLIGNVKGPQGATGATGQTGAQGPAATITVGSTTTTAYGNSAQVTNVGTSSAAVLDFVIPQGKPGEATTKMGDLVLDAITTSAADFPSPQVDDTGKVAFGKIVKFFSDVLSRFTKHAGDIATVSASPTTQNFTAGEYLINNDQLYKVTSNISSGGTITPGTNVSSTSVGAQLKSLNDSLVASVTPQIIRDTITGSSYVNTFYYRVISKVGSIIIIDLAWNTATLVPNWTQMMTIPEGYRPNVMTIRTRDVFSATAPYLIEITTGGAVRTGNASIPANTDITIHVEYVLEST